VIYFFPILLAVPIVVFGGLLAARITSGLTEDAEGGPHHGARSWTIRFAAILPYVCIAWWLLISIAHGSGDYRDVMGRPYAPLVNGYGLSVDNGVGLVGKLGRAGLVAASDTLGRAAFIESVQVTGATVLGFSRGPVRDIRRGAADQYYFLFDLKRATNEKFSTFTALQAAARARGFELKLEPSAQVYDRLTRRANDWVATMLFVVPPLAVTGLLGTAIVRLRRLPSPPRRW
jgi:hypothetical protein